MSNLLYRQNNSFVVTDSSNAPAASYKVTAYKRGAIVDAADTTTTPSVEIGHGFAAADKLILASAVDGSIDEDSYRTVQASGAAAGQLTLDSALTVVVGDVLINLGPDTGSGPPNYDGSPVSTYQDYAGGTANADAEVTTDATGSYEYWSDTSIIWELLRDSSNNPVGHVKDVFPSSIPKDQFHVDTYGADPTGSRDSSTEVQAAIDAADTNGGGFVLFGAGTYKCNVTLRGAGIHLRGILGAVPGGTVLKPNADSPIITTDTTDSVTRSSIDGFAFDGSDNQATFTSQDGIQVIPQSTDFVDELTIRNCRFDDMGRYGIYAQGESGSGPFVQKLTLEHCVFVGCQSEGLRLEGTCLETRVESCKWNGNSDANFTGTPGEDSQIKIVPLTADTTKVPLRTYFNTCTINNTQATGKYAVTVTGCKILTFEHCDFEESTREVLLEGVNLVQGVAFRSCNFSATQGDDSNDDMCINVRHCLGLTVDGCIFVSDGVGTRRKYCIDFLNTSGSNNIRDVSITPSNVFSTVASDNAISYQRYVSVQGDGTIDITDYGMMAHIFVQAAGAVTDVCDSIFDADGGIINLKDGQIIHLANSVNSGAGDITFNDGTGNLDLDGANRALTTNQDYLLLRWSRNDSLWYMLDFKDTWS